MGAFTTAEGLPGVPFAKRRDDQIQADDFLAPNAFFVFSEGLLEPGGFSNASRNTSVVCAVRTTFSVHSTQGYGVQGGTEFGVFSEVAGL